MSFVVTLSHFTPGIRLDGKPWTQGVIEEGALELGTFTAIDTQALSPFDTNPEQPQPRSFTTTKATRESGWYRIKFQDAAGNSQLSGSVYSPAQSQLGLLSTTVLGLDRLKRAIQDGRTSNGETLAIARLEDLSDQVMQQATPTATQFQVRFSALPTQGFVSTYVVPGSLVAYVDTNPAPVIPSEDVNTNAVFTLTAPPAERLQVTYGWAYFQDHSLEAFLDEARAWVAGPTTFANLAEVPDGLVPAVIDFAAARALRALAAKLQLASARAGDASSDWSDLTKAYSAQAKDHQATAEATRKSYYSRADQTLAPASSMGTLESGTTPPYTPIH